MPEFPGMLYVFKRQGKVDMNTLQLRQMLQTVENTLAQIHSTEGSVKKRI